MRFEEGTYRKPVLELFAQLEADFGLLLRLDPAKRESLALPVILQLGWESDSVYEADMKILVG